MLSKNWLAALIEGTYGPNHRGGPRRSRRRTLTADVASWAERLEDRTLLATAPGAVPIHGVPMVAMPPVGVESPQAGAATSRDAGRPANSPETASGSSPISTFVSLTNPEGVTVDNSGNVFVSTLSLFSDGGLYKFNSAGVLQGFRPLFGEFRLAMDERNGVIWAQETSGMLYAVNPDTLQATPVLNLNSLWKTTEPALNILTGKRVDLLMVKPQYGDISIYYVDQNDFDILVSGQTAAGGYPFVARLQARQQSLTNADILVASIPLPNIITPPPLDAQPPGLASDADGTVLTDLPMNVSGGISPFYLAGFNVNFPESGVGSPSFVKDADTSQVYSVGMAASHAEGGGFYVATVANGTGYGAGPAILHVSASLGEVDWAIDLTGYGLGNMAPWEVAVGPADDALYIVMTNQILKVTTPTPTPPTPTPPTPTPPTPTPPTPAPPPHAMGVVSVGHSKKGLTSITVAFDEALNSASLSNLGLYSVLGGVKTRKRIIYNKVERIKGASYNDNAHTVTINLAKPYKGVVQVTVHGGIVAANGASSLGDFRAIVK